MAGNETQCYRSVTKGSITLKIYTINRAGRTLFSVAFKENGKRILKQFSEEAEAVSWAEKRAKELDKGKIPSVTLSPDEGAHYLRAKKILSRLESSQTIDEAIEDYAEAVQILGGKGRLVDAAEYFLRHKVQVTQRTVPEIVKELLESRSSKSDTHLKDLKYRLGRFEQDMSGYIANITQKEIAAWLKGLNQSPRSHDNFRQTIVLLFRFAQKHGYLPEGRTEAEKTEPMGDSGEGEIAVFTPDEMSRLLKAATNDVLPYLALGAFAGIRTAEIARLDWSEINFQTGYIEIKKSKAKTKGRRLIKMQPNLVDWLKRVSKPNGRVNTLARPEKAASKGGAVSCNPPIVWKRNGLRHSFCTYRMAILQNEYQVSAEMGNSPAMVYANYRALATYEQGQEWFNIYPTSSI